MQWVIKSAEFNSLSADVGKSRHRGRVLKATKVDVQHWEQSKKNLFSTQRVKSHLTFWRPVFQAIHCTGTYDRTQKNNKKCAKKLTIRHVDWLRWKILNKNHTETEAETNKQKKYTNDAYLKTHRMVMNNHKNLSVNLDQDRQEYHIKRQDTGMTL